MLILLVKNMKKLPVDIEFCVFSTSPHEPEDNLNLKFNNVNLLEPSNFLHKNLVYSFVYV